MRVSRQAFVATAAGAFASIAVPRYPAGAAEFTYKLGTTTARNGHPITIRALEAADKIKLDTNGRVEINVFPSNALGSDLSMISQTRLGALEFILMVDTVLASLVPVVGVNSIPFAFASHQIALAAADGPLGRYTRNAIAKANLNMHPLEKKWDAGFNMLANNIRPIRVPADIKGLKLRIQSAPVPFEAFKTLGASPIALETPEIYPSLQTKLADGGELTLSGMEGLKLYEVLKYASVSNHVWLGYNMIANEGAWQRLPKNLRDIVEHNFNTGAQLDRGDVTRDGGALTAQLQSQGLAFNTVDVPAFQATLRASGLYSKWRDQFGAEGWGLLEQTVGPLRG